MTGPSFATPAPLAPAAHPGHKAAPKAPPPGRPALKPGAKPDEGGGLPVFTYLRLHWLMIVFCGSLLGAGGAALAWELLASKYESYGLFQVASAQTPIGNQSNAAGGRTDFGTYVKTTANLLKTDFVLNAALRDIKDLPTIKAQPDPIKYLEEEVVVAWQDGSEVIRVTFKGREPQDAKRIVDAIQNAFIKEVIDKEVKSKKAFLDLVEKWQKEIQRVLEAEKPAKAAGAAPAGAADAGTKPAAEKAPPGTPPEDILMRLDPGFFLKQFATLDHEVRTLPLTIAGYKRDETVMKDQLKALQDLEIPKATKGMMENDHEVVAQYQKMVRARTEYEFRLNAAENKTAPGILRLKAAYEEQSRKYEELKKDKIDAYDGWNRTKEAKVIAISLQKVIRDTQAAEERLEFSKKMLVEVANKVREIPIPADKAGGAVQHGFNEKEYTTSSSVLESTDGILRRLVTQYYQTKLELNSPQRVTVLQAGSHPTQKDTKKQLMGTIFAGVMGFALMAAGVVGFETVSRRVSSLAEVKAAVLAPVVGVVPGLPGAATGRDPVKRAAMNEAVDKLRAYVSQSWLSRGATTIAVTSAIGDEGKAFTAFGLASSLAQAGYKTLLVDFDLREPALHAFAGVPNQVGVCELLRAETDLRSAVLSLPSGLNLLPAGKWSDEARKAATGEKLENLLGRLKEPYDCVVLHGHALLTVAESVEVARRCEVVLVCARYRETVTPLLKRAAERVATMEIPFSGVVYVGSTEREALY
ncbi:tyrosine-protein kinase domain-containing protein [Frigoriglobus tundricola]|uniref:CobQ/CobB/MinD/ParA nucleotide binding domain-containing protein n=1 Tax=Frigoriglobus tundricola TaxID=2774151 RepID=A0A6M5YMU1_9BACT|nr:polysaccharide biosynthesis tyrosine autokinase [Frigoriglobus tundricola]QJW94252.1 hypothetical protein FTUN_1772 [Frigoriglobus tundricola]